MTVPMPSPFNDDAPHFDGKGESLYPFLDEFELVASLAGLDGSTRMKKVWSYVCREEREFWRGTAKYHTTWESYKDDVISCYAPTRHETAITSSIIPAIIAPSSISSAIHAISIPFVASIPLAAAIHDSIPSILDNSSSAIIIAANGLGTYHSRRNRIDHDVTARNVIHGSYP